MEIDVDSCSIVNSCGACPTVFDFEDTEGDGYYFRLRHGSARIVHDNTDEVLVSGGMHGFDGICNWDDVVHWAMIHGLKINE